MSLVSTLRNTVAAVGLVLASGLANAAVVSFSISGTRSQGDTLADLPETSVGLGGAGSFFLDPGLSGNYFDFRRPGGGTFSTIDTQISDQYFLRTYAAGDVIGAGNFGTNVSAIDDWDAILVDGATAGAWGSSHSGYLGFHTLAGLYGWIEYNFTRSNNISTITFLSGAYDDEVGADIIAGRVAVPEPGTLALLGLGLAGLGLSRRRRA